MYGPVECAYVAIVSIYRASAVDIDAVGVGHVKDTQLQVAHVRAPKLAVAHLREVVCHIILLVSAVDDAVIGDYLVYRVQQVAVGEGIPRGRADLALLDERLQIGVDGLVGRGEDGVVAACCQQLADARLALLAHRRMLQYMTILAVLLMLLEIHPDGRVLEHIAGRLVNFLLTPRCHEQYQARSEELGDALLSSHIFNHRMKGHASPRLGRHALRGLILCYFTRILNFIRVSFCSA